MNDFFKALQKTPERDPNLSWDTIIKSWEENFLGSNSNNDNFSYPLESDYSFSNNDKSNFLTLFDKYLDSKNAHNFNSIIQEYMYIMNNKNKKKIKEKNYWTIPRQCDYLSKPFLGLF